MGMQKHLNGLSLSSPCSQSFWPRPSHPWSLFSVLLSYCAPLSSTCLVGISTCYARSLHLISMAWPISPHKPFSIHTDHRVSYTYCVLCKCSKVYAKQRAMPVRKDLRNNVLHLHLFYTDTGREQQWSQAPDKFLGHRSTGLHRDTSWRRPLRSSYTPRKPKDIWNSLLSHSWCLATTNLQGHSQLKSSEWKTKDH